MTVAFGNVHAQGEEALPPHVIDVWPLPGVELAGSETLSITFDQPMNRASVEQALNMEPALAARLAWADDRVLQLIPDEGWPRATSFSVTVGTAALAQNGLALQDAFQFDTLTIGALEVTGVTPGEAAEGVAADARIVVTFNRPVVPLVSTSDLAALPSPLEIMPAVEGAGEWLNTSIYQFTPSEALQGGTDYTVTVNAGLETVTGAVLQEDYVWQFRTLVPQILDITPRPNESGVLLDRSVVVIFSQPMDRPSTEEAFTLLAYGQQVSGSFSWSADDSILTFTPEPLLNIDTIYALNIGPEARSASGTATLDGGQSTTFSTIPYPGIQSTYPRNGERSVRPGGGAQIEFRSPMNAETFADKVRIEPETVWQPVVWHNQTLSLEFYSLPNTTYTITLLAGAEDIYGNVIQTDHTFSYTTGDIATWAYPITANSNFAITGAYRQDTRFPIFVSGTPTVMFDLYRVELADVVEDSGYYYYDDRLPAWATPERLVRSWSQTFDSQGREGVAKEVLLASEQGGVLEQGVYWVVMRTPRRGMYQFPLAVVSANLTVKRAADEVLIWVTDMPTARPVVDTTVTIYHNGKPIARGGTDSEGVFRAPVDLPRRDDRGISIVTEGAGSYGVWFSYDAPYLPEEQGYLYTDRPIYRPGQTVYFRGVLRDRADMDYSIPNQRTVHTTIESMYTGQQLLEADLPVTEFGTFSGELVLPEDAPLGDTYISAGSAHVAFSIAEFRVPEYEVTMIPQQDDIFQGQPFNALMQASYYFGGNVSGAEVFWNAYGEAASFDYTGPGRYTFGDAQQEYFHHYIGDGTAVSDADGQVLITSENTRPPSIRPMRITVEATVTDESQQAISGRATLLAHPANAYVGLRAERYFGREAQPLDFNLIAVTADSAPLVDKRLDLTVVEIRWSRIPVEGQFGRYHWEQEEIEVETAQVRTGSDGTAVFTFTPPNAGIFRLSASVLDEYERVNASSMLFWVTGNRPVWWGEPSQTIDLIADQEGYQPGDMAQILVPIPFAGASTVLVSMERAGIMHYDVLEVEGSTLLYELPITEDFVPTVHVDVTVVKGVDEESLNPDYRSGQITLDVAPVRQQLTVTVTPSAMLTQPRETLTFDVRVVGADGEPVEAEVGLALTDKAILALMPPNSGTLTETFFGYQPNYIRTDHSLGSLLDRLTDQYVGVEQEEQAARMSEDMAFGAGIMPSPTMGAMAMADGAPMPGAPGGQAVTIREDFEQTPLWAAHVVTGMDGTATVSVELPDNLTTWSLDARAITQQTEVGQATTEVMTTLPLLIRPVAPRFFVVDDRVQLAAVVNNNTSAVQQVEVTLAAEGVVLEDAATQVVAIEPGARARVEWLAVAQDVEYVDLTFYAIGADGYQDAVKPTLATGPDNTIPVYRYTAPDTVGTAGILREAGARTEGVSLPPRLDADQGELTIRLDPSLAVTVTDTFDYLKNYPHQCIEQTVSRFLPNVITYRALRDLGIQDPVLEANLYSVLEEALAKLVAEQNPDGGWGWFVRMDSNTLVTAYAALGLIEAQAAGFDIDRDMLSRALNYVRTDYMQPRLETSAWRLNRQAFYFYVLARGGQGNLADYEALYHNRLEMSYQGRAYLLMAYAELYPEQSAVSDLVSDLTTGAILSATGAHWEEAYNDWWNWSSDTRTTAVVLAALARVTPDNDLLPNAVRWLMVARQGDHWETTQESAWATIALTDWMVLTGELRGAYEYALTVNEDVLARTTVTPESVREGEVIRVAVRDLLLEDLNRVVVARGEGEGALYYTAHLNLRLPAAEADAISRGITVNREYFLASDPEAKPITSVDIGETVTVRLTLTLPQDIHYFALEDPIPAGTEGVDTSLLTTSQQVEGPVMERVEARNPRWYWGWWWFDRTEMRDEQVNLYADFLPRGTYVYTYQIRASVAGEFQTMPAHAYSFYFPEVFGRTDGMLFTVNAAAAAE